LPASSVIGRRAVLWAGGWAAGLAQFGMPLPSVAAPVVEIRMRGNADGSKVWYDPVGVLIEPGQVLRWVNTDPGNAHTSTAYHPRNNGRPLRIPEGGEPWDSDYLLPGGTFELRLSVPGVYDYFCTPHEEAGMAGRIVVGRPAGGAEVSADTLPEPARRVVPPVAEIVRRGVVGFVP